MGNHDISSSFTESEMILYKFLETVKEKLYDNREIKLTYIDEDVYMQKILEYFYDGVQPNAESITVDNLVTIDLTPVFSNFIFSIDLAKVILELLYSEKMFMVNNPVEYTMDNLSTYIDVTEIYDELIDNGVVSGTDIALFTSKNKGIEMISRFIVATTTLMKDNGVFDTELLFLGWLYPSRIIFLKYKTVMEK
jgi:hypothetical protein